jgi:hypothetical protein
MRHTTAVCINSISPMAMGCFICVNINLVIVLVDISNFVMSGGILFKTSVLGINEMVFDFSSEVLKGHHLFRVTAPISPPISTRAIFNFFKSYL